MRQFLARLAPAGQPYLHNDLQYREAPIGWPGGWEAWAAQEPENAHSHLLSMVLGNSETIPITGGKLALGQWQSVMLVELDGARARTVGVQLAALALVCSPALTRAAPAECAAKPAGEDLDLKADSSTVHWGYFYDGLEPNLVVASGDTVSVKMITHHEGDDYDKMIKGDPGVEDIYKWTKVITIYEVVEEADGTYSVATDYQFRFADGPTGYPGPTTPCVESNVSLPDALEGMEMSFENPATFSGKDVPCIKGKQTWAGYYYPGLLTVHPTGTEDYSIRGKFKIPANIHIGNIGLAPKYDTTVDSVPPLVTGDNMDNRRVGKGNTLYLPVQVAGAYLSMGDAHMAQGDSELDGTGVETSINGKFKLTLHKNASLPSIVKGLTFPLIEQPDSFVVQGYTFADYLSELDDPMSTIYSSSSIAKAMTVAYNNTRDWMMGTFNFTEDQAITFITIAVDFGITQVVNGNWGVHAIVPKKPLGLETTAAAAPTPAPTPAPKSAASAGAAAGALTLLAAALLAAVML
ncbi:acetamidase [Micractinium conductrix]|uniref:Acetamidase n=1 Tax=Micractinium conductrix TaxID=554055 RepID=A0A2P6V1M2_9CHLO|nr:acetamidase [Micractinium conductrix]|eukprot:PSC67996.1 acetamidase [Micractinium conductrix]